MINNLEAFSTRATNNFTPGTFVVGAILLVATLFLLFYNVYFYKKNNIKLFTTKKIVIMSMFFAVYLLQSIFTGIQSSDSILLVSFDSASIIIVSFIFGPIEGFIYAVLADNIRVLIINQWLWQALYAFQYPLMALICGTIARKYRSKVSIVQEGPTNFEKHPYIYFSIVQATFMFIFLFSALIAYYNPTYVENEDLVFKTIIYYSLAFIILWEIIYIFLISFEKYRAIELLTILLVITVLNRYLVVLIPASIADINSGWRPSLGAGVIPRIFKSSYLIPSSMLVNYFIISIYFNVVEKNKLNEW